MLENHNPQQRKHCNVAMCMRFTECFTECLTQRKAGGSFGAGGGGAAREGDRTDCAASPTLSAKAKLEGIGDMLSKLDCLHLLEEWGPHHNTIVANGIMDTESDDDNVSNYTQGTIDFEEIGIRPRNRQSRTSGTQAVVDATIPSPLPRRRADPSLFAGMVRTPSEYSSSEIGAGRAEEAPRRPTRLEAPLARNDRAASALGAQPIRAGPQVVRSDRASAASVRPSGEDQDGRARLRDLLPGVAHGQMQPPPRPAASSLARPHEEQQVMDMRGQSPGFSEGAAQRPRKDPAQVRANVRATLSRLTRSLEFSQPDDDDTARSGPTTPKRDEPSGFCSRGEPLGFYSRGEPASSHKVNEPAGSHQNEQPTRTRNAFEPSNHRDVENTQAFRFEVQETQPLPGEAQLPSEEVQDDTDVEPEAPPAVEPLFAEEVDEADELHAQEAQVDHGRYEKLGLKLKEDGILPLIEAAFEDESTTKSRFAQDIAEHESVWVGVCYEVLLSMDEDVIIAISAGNLAQCYDESKAAGTVLAKYLDRFEQRAEDQPSLYIRQFCSKQGGHALTVEQAKLIYKHAVNYAKRVRSHDDSAYMIDKVFDDDDQWTVEASRQGYRWLLQTRSQPLSKQRVDVMLAFAAALKKRIHVCEATGAAYLPPMYYTGYAFKGSHRRTGHESRKATSTLITFSEAIAQALWPEQFEVRMFFVALLGEEPHCAFGEMCLTRITNSYYHAGGFNVDQAGKSVASSRLDNALSDEERTAYWTERFACIKANTRFVANEAAEWQRCDKLLSRRARATQQQQRAEIMAYDNEITTLVNRCKDQLARWERLPAEARSAEQGLRLRKRLHEAEQLAEPTLKEPLPPRY